MAVGLDQLFNGEELKFDVVTKFESITPANIHTYPLTMDANGDGDGDNRSSLENGSTSWIRNADIKMKDEVRAVPFKTSQRKRVLLSTSTPFADTVIRSLYRDPDIELRLIVQHDLTKGEDEVKNVKFYPDTPQNAGTSRAREWMNITAAALIEWADILILSPIDAGTLGSMVAGLTWNLTLTIIRGWDSSNRILLTPGMTVREWTAPITRRQLDEVRVFWPWVKILPPVLSRFEAPERLVEMPWDGREIFYEEMKRGLGWPCTADDTDSSNNDIETPTSSQNASSAQSTVGEKESPPNQTLCSTALATEHQTSLHARAQSPLPPEILSMIFEALGDWEVAAAVGVYAKIPMPEQWKPLAPKPHATSFALEYTILRRPYHEIERHLSLAPPWKPLSNTAAHLIFKFSRIDILDYIYNSRSDLYWATPRLSNLPFRASSVYGNTSLLDWWIHCPDLPKNDYLPDALDSASRAGYVHVLEWWRKSGLPLRYTEKALESASAEGQTTVLDWWKRTSESSPKYDPVPLKVGKSALLAAQSGRTNSLAWWDKSGIPYSHTDSVARIASTHGHVAVLGLWFRLKGSKMIFDNQVLVGATKNGHVDVLEWWRRSGLRVEFKTCDIEEALEDAVSGAEERVRRWWERNGLNLGVGTSEWMKVKVL